MLAEVSLSIPDTASPWFFWITSFGFTLTCLITCFTCALKAGKVCDAGKNEGGFIGISLVTGIIGVVSLIYSAVIFYSIFSASLPPATGG